jgi:hypothetical protein
VTERRTIIGLVAEQALWDLGSANEAIGDRTIVDLAAGQDDGEETAFSICECVDLRISPSSRTADPLILRPPFPPAAERWALTCVASIIWRSVARQPK